MSIQKLKEGVIYQVSELLPIHSSSSYAKDNAQVVPDNDKWLKVQTSRGNFAFHKSFCHLYQWLV